MLLTLAVAYGVTLTAAGVYAFFKRAHTSTWACVTVAVGWLLSILLVEKGLGWRHIQLGVLVADTLVLIAFFAIAALSRRRWAIVAAAAQLAAICIHVGFATNPGLWFPAYAGALQVCSWLVLISIAIGLLVDRPPTKFGGDVISADVD